MDINAFQPGAHCQYWIPYFLPHEMSPFYFHKELERFPTPQPHSQSYKSNSVPPPQIFGLVGPPKKRVNRDKLNHRQKLRVMCFNQQFCTKINYFSSIQCFILMYPPPSFTHEKSHPVSCFCLCESHIIRQETDSESRMIQVSTIVVSLHYSESSEESNR